jgi:hypothetical protein
MYTKLRATIAEVLKYIFCPYNGSCQPWSELEASTVSAFQPSVGYVQGKKWLHDRLKMISVKMTVATMDVYCMLLKELSL